jgi:hypothetical protein
VLFCLKRAFSQSSFNLRFLFRLNYYFTTLPTSRQLLSLTLIHHLFFNVFFSRFSSSSLNFPSKPWTTNPITQFTPNQFRPMTSKIYRSKLTQYHPTPSDLTNPVLAVLERLFKEKLHWQNQCMGQTDEIAKQSLQISSLTREAQREFR